MMQLFDGQKHSDAPDLEDVMKGKIDGIEIVSQVTVEVTKKD